MIRKAVMVIPQDEDEARWLKVKIAGVPLLKRVILSAERAGVQDFFIMASQRGAGWRDILKGDRQSRARIHWMEGTLPPLRLDEPFFLLQGNVLFEGRVLSELSKVALDGAVVVAVRVPVRPRPDLDREKDGFAMPGVALASPKLLDLVRGRGLSLDDDLLALAYAGGAKCCDVEGLLCQAIDGPEALREAEARLLRSLWLSTDGRIVDRFLNRKLSRIFTRLLIHFPVTPNQVTLAGFLIGLLAAWLFLAGGYWPSLLGAVLFQLSTIVDLVDGELARLKFMESRLGKWLDHNCDNLVHLAIIASIAVSRFRATGEQFVLYLGGMAALGVFISYLMVFSAILLNKRTPSPAPDMGSLDAGSSARAALARRLEGLANRDFFSLSLFACFLLGQPIWFLEILAVGANAYWVVWLVLKGAAHGKARER